MDVAAGIVSGQWLSAARRRLTSAPHLDRGPVARLLRDSGGGLRPADDANAAERGRALAAERPAVRRVSAGARAALALVIGFALATQLAVAATMDIPLGRSLGMFTGNLSQPIIAAAILRRLGQGRILAKRSGARPRSSSSRHLARRQLRRPSPPQPSAPPAGSPIPGCIGGCGLSPMSSRRLCSRRAADFSSLALVASPTGLRRWRSS